MSSATKASAADATPSTAPPELPPSAQIFGLQTGALVPQMLQVVTMRGIPDLLVDGPRASSDLAAASGLHERSLYRVLRSLAGLGFFAERSRGLFELKPLGRALTSADGSGARELAVLVEWWWKAMGEFARTVETGTDGMTLAYGMSFFEFLAANPTWGENFDRAVKGAHAGEKEAVANTYDFSSAGSVMDVGCGSGFLLAEVLRRHPGATGMLFDLPAVIAGGNEELDGLRDRCDTVAGDFFASVPTGADCYMLSHIIHDWDESSCLQILRNCRQAMDERGRLLLIETVIPPGNDPHPGKMLDMVMLCVTGGMERTEVEYGELLAAAGLTMTRVIPTRSAVSIIEALPTP